MVNGARIVGPAVAGVLVGLVGEGWCFLANAVSYIAVIVGLLLMQLTPRVLPERSGSGFADIIEGFQFVARTGPIRALLLLLGVVSLMGMPYAVLMPVFSDQILHGGASGLGYTDGRIGLRRDYRRVEPCWTTGHSRAGALGCAGNRRLWTRHYPLF